MILSRRRQFDEDLDRIRDANRKVFEKCCALIRELETDRLPFAKLRSEGRLPRGKKYELPAGYRAVFQQDRATHALIALRVGKHDDMDRFLNEHSGRQVHAPADSGPRRIATTSAAARSKLADGDHAVADGHMDRSVWEESVERDDPKPPMIFHRVQDNLFKNLGIPLKTIASLRAVDNVTSPFFQDLLLELERINPEVANRLLEYATADNPDEDRALLALTSRTSSTFPAEEEKRHDAAPSLSSAKSETPGGERVSGRSKRRPRQLSTRGRIAKKQTRDTLRPAENAARRKTAVGSARVRTTATGKPKAAPGRLRPRTEDATTPIRTFGALKRVLSAYGLHPLDNRPFGGGIWVLAGQRPFASAKRDLARRGIACKFHPAGSRKREREASWQIDVGKQVGKR